ncbi:MAG: hypothetical protein A3K19_04920 [Lentisphaerae bacterium RIFOXYB12_FULL_65_16]|nr:MAG: hypothetical protein A3K18_35140 [Lentisphaerae bacterium RIFOXYA12_64_32]OGV89733.1 MAG: hypothetical protein A3K19_04920 [Lentisphaerae bacterium RIFOXYB12_FULL_65_16]
MTLQINARRVLFFLVVATSVTSLGLADPSGTPLPLPNSSFEDGADANGTPDGWQWRVAQGTAKCELVNETAGQGKRSVKLSSDNPATRAFLEGPRSPVKPGRAYLFECRAKSLGVQAGMPVLGISQYKADGTWDNWSYCLKIPRNADWALYRQLFTIPATTTAIALRVWIEQFQGAAWFDDVAVREYEPPTPGWTDAFADPAAWQTDGATLSRTDRGGVLQSQRQRDDETLFPVGRMTREVEIDLAKYPCLALDIAAVKGLWALKVQPRGYAQYASRQTGQFYYDLRKTLGATGAPKVKLTIEALGDQAEVTIAMLSLLPEAPPSVGAADERTSRYVTPAVTLDGLKRDLPHPFVAVSREEIERARGKGKVFDEWLAACRGSADGALKQPVEIPDDPCVYVMEYNCPKHGVPLTWREKSPAEHLCPAGNHIVTGRKFDQQWRMEKTNRAHDRNQSSLRRLGMAYAFAGDERYAARAREILVGYTEKFPNYPFHSGRGELTPEGDGMRVSHQPLSEAGWLADIAKGYDLVAASACFSEANHRAIREMLAEDVKVSLRYDEGLSNRQAHHNLAVSAVGLILGDEFLIRRTLGSLRYQLQYAILGDGQWWECSPGYHFYAVRTLLDVAETFQRVGLDVTRDPKLRLSYDAPLDFLWPDGTLPAVNDSHLGMKLPASDYEAFFHLYRDPVYADILKVLGNARRKSFGYLVYGDEPGECRPLDSVSHNFDQAGMTVIKAQRGEGDLSVVMDYGQAVMGHGHADKLNLQLFANGRLLVPDIGTRNYFSPVYRFWDRQTLSHNAVVVDERSQKHECGRMTLCDITAPLQVVQATANQLYPCLNQMRTLFVMPRYVVDLFRVTEDATDVRLNPEPSIDIPFWTKEPCGSNTPESLRRDLARFERSRVAHSGNYSAMIAQSEGIPAAWSSDIRSLTGPNCLYRRGVIRLEPKTEYRLSAWVKTDSATGSTGVEVAFLNDQCAWAGGCSPKSLQGTQDWTELTATATSPANATWAQARCYSRDNAGTAWFDDIRMVRVGDPEAKNVLTPNFDFELVTIPHQTVDYVLHAYGSPTSDVTLSPTQQTFGEQTDDPYYDGQNSYRFLKNLRSGDTSGPWQVQWQDGQTGLRLLMLEGANTRVFLGDGQGPETTTIPMLMARRTEPNTVFAAVLEPYREKPELLKVSRLSGGAASPTASIEGSGVRVDTTDGPEFFAVSFTPGAKVLGPLSLDAAAGSLAFAADGRELRWMYLLDGKRLSSEQGSISTPGSHVMRIIESDDRNKTVAVEGTLPAGEILKGAPFILELPYNACYTVSSVEARDGRSIVHLAGLPNLYLRAGMTARIPVRAMLRRLRPDVFELSANAPSEFRLARARPPERILLCDETGKATELKPVMENGHVVLAVGPTSRTCVAIDPPAGASLADHHPPVVEKLIVGKDEMKPATEIVVPFLPRQVAVTLTDETGLDTSTLRLTLNGRPAGPAEADIKTLAEKGRTVLIDVHPETSRVESIDLEIQDLSLMQNALRFQLKTAPPVAIIPITEASGGKLVKLAEPEARLTAALDLPKGDYEINLVSRAPNDGANSVWLELDGKRVEHAVHLRTDRLDASSRQADMSPALSRLSVPQDGPHRLIITLRESPGPELDKLQILQGGKVIKELECEDMLPQDGP